MTTTIAVPTETDQERAAYIEGLRQVADWLEAHPEVELPWLGFEPKLSIYLVGYAQREPLAAIARAMGSFEKIANGDDYFQIVRRFAGIAVVAQASRDEVCEKVVVGTTEVTEEVPDPVALAAVPKVTVTKTVEQVEWRCGSLLAPAVAA